MPETTLELRSINALLKKNFFIPHYQRGYRWTELQVTQLLDDIDSFSADTSKSNPNEKTFYCLQPIVVKLMDDAAKAKHDLSGVWYEVIDGQQRLTTIYLVIQYINDMWSGRQKKDSFYLNYETRENCVEFLKQIKVNDDGVTVTIDQRNIDFYYISNAYRAIRNWESNFSLNSERFLDSDDFKSKLFSHSKVIWYEVPSTELGQALFERLNLGKIPLTNAELIKALFLSDESLSNTSPDERKIIQFNIARLWDEIEHKLNAKDEKFWSFITNKDINSFETKIELVLDLIAGKKDDERDHLFTFLDFNKKQRAGDVFAIWQEIEQFYYTVSEWYLDKEHYHKIGYLVAAKRNNNFRQVNLGELVKDSMKMTKDKFSIHILNLIKESVKFELSELRYDNHNPHIYNVLLLFNIEMNLKSDAISEYYPFKQLKGNKWSIEHIHARKSEDFDQTKQAPWLKWLSLHKISLMEMLDSNVTTEQSILISNAIADIDKWNTDQLTWQQFELLFRQINDIFTHDLESMDRESEGLSNLALLSQPDNAALNNAVFEIKRKEIIRLDKEGHFIPICTKRVFMKYYNEEGVNTQHFFWSSTDREKYLQAIKDTLEDYLPNNHNEIVNENK